MVTLSAQNSEPPTDDRNTVLGFARGAACAASIALAGAPTSAAVSTSVMGGVTVIVDSPATPAPARAPRRRARPMPAASRATSVPAQAFERPSTIGVALARDAQQFLGVPYVWGGASPSGFDCSGFVQFVYARRGIAIPRTADAQFAAGVPVAGNPQPGDLVFFQTYDYGASHVGIYLGNGYFVNSLRPGVHVASFASAYFRERYLGARRYVRDG